jgi:hypothetical protein
MRANWVTWLIGVFAVLILLGGGFVVYQYINTKDPTATLRRQEARRQVASGSVIPGTNSFGTTSASPAPAANTASFSTLPSTTAPTSGPGDILPPGVTTPTPLPNPETQSTLPMETVNAPTTGAIQNESGVGLHPDASIPVPNISDNLRRQSAGGNSGAGLGRVEIEPDRYLFNNLDPSALGGDTVVLKDDGKSFDLNTFAPEGEAIEVVMATNASTDSAAVPVMAAVYLPFYYKGHLLLPIGTRLLGKAAPGEHRDRMNITFDKIILKSPYEDIGKTVTITGIATDLDGTVGVQGYRIGNDLLTTLVPILLNFSNSFTASLEQNQTYNSGYGGTVQTPLVSGQNAALQATQSSLQSINQLIAQDVEDNKPYVLVLAGTRLKVVLSAPLDTSKKGYGL